MMRENEVHKFSDGTLTRILEKLDHMVKDYVLFKFNPDMKNRIWFEDDKRRSKEFIEMLTTDLSRELNDFIILTLSQNQRDLPKDNPLVSVEVLRNRVNTSAVRITMMIADIEESRHGPSDAMHNPP
ncbi:hypothetical protein Tco_0656754 [Tanacetum coccineum]|uniref:Uncharacterized protein n=1 Tax=Tanacetum coccineum TaxID=301880 RepID=A0ABQ4XAC3_9ASTR